MVEDDIYFSFSIPFLALNSNYKNLVTRWKAYPPNFVNTCFVRNITSSQSKEDYDDIEISTVLYDFNNLSTE